MAVHYWATFFDGTLFADTQSSFEAEVYVDNKPESHSFAGERTRMTEAEVLAAAGVETGGDG